MTSKSKPYNELYSLFDDLCDGSISESDASKLDAVLRTDSAARWEYLCYLDVHAGLGLVAGNDECGTPNSALQNPCDSAQPSSPAFLLSTSQAPLFTDSYVGSMLFSYVVAALVMGVGLTITSFLCVSQPAQFVQHSPQDMRAGSPWQAGNTPTAICVGRITDMADCVLKDSRSSSVARDQKNLKSPVSLGDRFSLHSGLMEITYDTGAKVILQGPVTYEVDSAAGGYLTVGKLTARLDKKEKNSVSRSPLPVPSSLFAVRTPTAVVTDLGTEFGVEVNEEGRTFSHVFRGSVEVRTVSTAGGNGAAVRILHAEESVQVAAPVAAGESSTSEIRLIQMDSRRFVRRIASQASATQTDLPMQVVAWFRLGEDDLGAIAGSKVTNKTMNHCSNRYHLSPRIPPTYSEKAAPYGSSLSMHFDGADNECLTDSHIPYTINEDFVLEAWVCPSKIDEQYHYVVYNGDPAFNGYGILMNKGHWKFIFGMVGFFDSGVSCELGKWTHLALVCDREKAQLWVNGRPAGKPTALRVRIPDASFSIGCDHTTNPPFAFRGEIDEVRLSKLLGPFQPAMLLFKSPPSTGEKGTTGQ